MLTTSVCKIRLMPSRKCTFRYNSRCVVIVVWSGSLSFVEKKESLYKCGSLKKVGAYKCSDAIFLWLSFSFFLFRSIPFFFLFLPLFLCHILRSFTARITTSAKRWQRSRQWVRVTRLQSKTMTLQRKTITIST